MIFRKATELDCRDLWEWRNSEHVRRWCFASEEINYDGHKKWLAERLPDEMNVFFIAEDLDGSKLGHARFSIEGGTAQISVNMNPAFIGKGLGTDLIRGATEELLKERKEVKDVRAVIVADNLRSQKAFEKAGYKYAGEGQCRGKEAKIFMFRGEADET